MVLNTQNDTNKIHSTRDIGGNAYALCDPRKGLYHTPCHRFLYIYPHGDHAMFSQVTFTAISMITEVNSTSVLIVLCNYNCACKFTHLSIIDLKIVLMCTLVVHNTIAYNFTDVVPS